MRSSVSQPGEIQPQKNMILPPQNWAAGAPVIVPVGETGSADLVPGGTSRDDIQVADGLADAVREERPAAEDHEVVRFQA